MAVQDVSVEFGDRAILSHCSVELREGESLTLIGPSGGGKTTLLRVVLGLQNPTSGQVSLLGVPQALADDQRWFQLRNRFGVVFQQGALLSSLTVAENIAFPVRELQHVAPEVIDALVRMKAASVGLAMQDLGKMPAQLSGGMIKRVALARSLVLDPELVFFDEPTAGLDPIAARRFISLIKSVRARGRFSQLMISHDLEVVNALSDRVAVLWEGTIVAVDTLDRIKKLDNPFVREYFAAMQ